MSYCYRCGGILLEGMPTEFINGKEYHSLCALKEAYRRIPLTKEHRADSIPTREGHRVVLPRK